MRYFEKKCEIGRYADLHMLKLKNDIVDWDGGIVGKPCSARLSNDAAKG